MSHKLQLQLKLLNHDDLYEEFLESHRGLSVEDSALLNASIILILSNHIGKIEIVRQAIQQAKKSLDFQTKHKGG